MSDNNSNSNFKKNTSKSSSNIRKTSNMPKFVKLNEKSHILKNNPVVGSQLTETSNQQVENDNKGEAKTIADDAVPGAVLETPKSKKGQKDSKGSLTTPSASTPSPSIPISSKGKKERRTTGETELEALPQQAVTENDMSHLVQGMDLEGNDVPSHPKSTLAHASFNYINSILGSGVIGMPYALHQAGVGMGLILMIFVAYITDYSLVLMVRAGQLSGSYSYQGMMESAFGRWGFYILSLLQLVYPLIAMISYNIIVGDTLTKAFVYFSPDPNEVRFQREAVVLAATLFVTLPLSLYRNVARMSKVSFFSLVSIGCIMISILIRLDTSPQPWTSDSWKFANTGVVQAIGIFAFAFMCHHNTFMIYSSMEETSESKWQKVTHVSIGTSLFVSLIFSLGGYATFTGNVQGDLLENYCWNDDLINISRFLFCITILLTFPLECFVVRDVIENFWFKEKQPSTTSRHFSITFSIVITAYVISMSTDCLGIVLELNGVLAAIPLAYILPSLCYIRLEPSRLFSSQKLPALGIAFFGIIVSSVGLLMLIINGQSSNCSHGQPMPYCATVHSFLMNATGQNISGRIGSLNGRFPATATLSPIINTDALQLQP